MAESGNRGVTSHDIARAAGVSRSTVSRVINGYSNVPDKTREKVMKVIQEMRYYPSFSGQVLAGKGTRTLGFIVVSPGRIADDIQFSRYCAYVVECAAQHGYLVLTCIVKSLRNEKDADWVRRIFLENRVDAGVVIGADNDEPLIEELIADGRIIGLFDHFHPKRNEPNRISVNYEVNTGEKMIDYLYRLGHRKIGIINGNERRYSLVCRRKSFLDGMRKHDLPIRSEWMYEHLDALNGGYVQALELLDSGTELPTAICAYNDIAAFGVYQAFSERGIRIPEDISVIGNDGHDKGAIITPNLTTFAFPYRDIFFSLVNRVIAAVEGETNVQTTEFFESRLIERQSCRQEAGDAANGNIH